jgi:hypothetical protein
MRRVNRIKILHTQSGDILGRESRDNSREHQARLRDILHGKNYDHKRFTCRHTNIIWPIPPAAAWGNKSNLVTTNPPATGIILEPERSLRRKHHFEMEEGYSQA